MNQPQFKQKFKCASILNPVNVFKVRIYKILLTDRCELLILKINAFKVRIYEISLTDDCKNISLREIKFFNAPGYPTRCRNPQFSHYCCT